MILCDKLLPNKVKSNLTYNFGMFFFFQVRNVFIYYRIKLPIIKKIQYFLHFLNQIEQILCHWTHKLEGYKYSLSVKNKGAIQKTQ